jgi:predicted dehydrogenase
LLRTCETNGARLAINHNGRGDPYIRRARQLLQDGAIGDILTITITWAGRLFLSGTHFFDLVNYFVGDIPTAWLIGHAEEPTAQMTVVPTQRGVDVGGTAYAVYQNGVRAFFNGRDGHTFRRRVISGTEGSIIVDDHDAQLWKLSETGSFRQLLKYPFPQMMKYTAPMVYLLEDLIEAMETGRDPMSSGRTARHALEQILATHYSSQHDHCKVVFPFEDPDLSPPFQWFGEGGQALYRASSPGAQD